MNDARGGDPDRIAPIIPLFGAGSRAPGSTRPAVDSGNDASPERLPRDDDEANLWHPTWSAPRHGPVSGRVVAEGSPSENHPARGSAGRPVPAAERSERSAPSLRALDVPRDLQGDGVTAQDDSRSAAEETLVRRLRTRSLSVSEARQVLRGHDLEAGVTDDIVDDFCRRGYLDDDALAESLVRAGVERKGQGRVALSRALAQRGIPREVIDRALDELPDDDDERALEFARGKAKALSRLDHEIALRRLVGQLSRRGYNGAVAMNAARAALREASSPGSGSGVRFVDSD